MPEGETSRRASELLLGASSPKVRRLECIRRTCISSRFRHRAIAFVRRQTPVCSTAHSSQQQPPAKFFSEGQH